MSDWVSVASVQTAYERQGESGESRAGEETGRALAAA